MTINDIIIDFLPKCSEADIERLISAIRQEHSIRESRKLNFLELGKIYSFIGRGGEQLSGKLIKLNKTSASLCVSYRGNLVTWKVSPSLLTLVTT